MGRAECRWPLLGEEEVPYPVLQGQAFEEQVPGFTRPSPLLVSLDLPEVSWEVNTDCPSCPKLCALELC